MLSFIFENQVHKEKVNSLYFCHSTCHQKLHMWLKRQMLPIFHQYYLGSFFPYSLEKWGLVMQLWPGPRYGIPNQGYWWICRSSKNWKCVWICCLVKLVFSWNWFFISFYLLRTYVYLRKLLIWICRKSCKGVFKI